MEKDKVYPDINSDSLAKEIDADILKNLRLISDDNEIKPIILGVDEANNLRVANPDFTDSFDLPGGDYFNYKSVHDAELENFKLENFNKHVTLSETEIQDQKVIRRRRNPNTVRHHENKVSKNRKKNKLARKNRKR